MSVATAPGWPLGSCPCAPTAACGCGCPPVACRASPSSNPIESHKTRLVMANPPPIPPGRAAGAHVDVERLSSRRRITGWDRWCSSPSALRLAGPSRKDRLAQCQCRDQAMTNGLGERRVCLGPLDHPKGQPTRQHPSSMESVAHHAIEARWTWLSPSRFVVQKCSCLADCQVLRAVDPAEELDQFGDEPGPAGLVA